MKTIPRLVESQRTIFVAVRRVEWLSERQFRVRFIHITGASFMGHRSNVFAMCLLQLLSVVRAFKCYTGNSFNQAPASVRTNTILEKFIPVS